MSQFETIALLAAWVGSIIAGFQRKTIFSKVNYSTDEDGPRFFWSFYFLQMLLLTGATLFVILT